MGIFGDIRPKGITEKELRYVEGELLNGSDHLNKLQVQLIIGELAGYMDADNIKHPEWKQMNVDEVHDLETRLSNQPELHLTPKQVARAKMVLEKYLNVNRTDSFI